MRSLALAFLAVVASAAAQGVTDKIAPTATPAAGCKQDIEGKFEIAVVKVDEKQKRDEVVHNRKRAVCSGNGVLLAELNDGVITDSEGRTGYIASNYQFQFDKPPQAGAIYTAGFSHCPNGSLALGDSAVFYQCKSGNFYNLYDRWWAEQCEPVDILVMPCGGENTGVSNGQNIVGTEVVTTTVVVPLSDGQPQVITTTQAVPVCQIGDGQIQGHTTPCASLTTPTPTPVVSVPPVSQYSDGQIQVTPNPPPPPAPAPTVTGSGEGSFVSAPPPVPTGNETTLRTTAGVPTTPAVVPTSAPGANSAGRVKLGSAVALAVGFVGVALFL